MSLTTRVFVLTIAASAMVSTVAAQGSPDTSKAQISPRRLFYDCDVPPCGDAAPAQHKATPKTPSKGKSAPKAGTPAAAPVHAPNGAQITPAVVEARPLALRYKILNLDRGNAEVSPDSTFHANDRIQLAVETNGPGYLYVINQGSSGAWTPMFPQPDIAKGNNYVDGRRVYILPSEDHDMRFDEHSGTENLFIAFSRVPVADLEEFIYSLKSQPRMQPTPAAPAKENDKQIIADARIDNATVERLRTAYSRDLIVEKVTPDTPPETPEVKKETAVYVAGPSGRTDAPLVADLHLVHR